MRVFLTGDTHGDFRRFAPFYKEVQPSEDDVMIVLGDAALNYSRDEKDHMRKRYVSGVCPMTFLFVHGNHEIRPADVGTYKMKQFCGGVVWYEEEFPNLLFAKDGEVYQLGEYTFMPIGGAYSVDKFYRLQYGYPWFETEQPSDEIKAFVENQLEKRNYEIDVVLSHTVPERLMPTEVFLSGLDQAAIDRSTEKWLEQIEARLKYKKWYAGHFHTEKKIERLQFMFENIEELSL